MPKNWFNRPLPLPKVQRSGYDLGEDRLQTMRLSRLVPFGIQECIPSDIHMFSHDAFLRLAPLKYPVLQKLNINLTSFFVPERLILDEDKSAELHSSLEPSEKLIPKLRLAGGEGGSYGSLVFGTNCLADYFGIQVDADLVIDDIVIPNPVPFLAYVMIVRDYFVDENLQADWVTAANLVLDSYKDVPLGGTLTIQDIDDEPTELGTAFRKVISIFHVNKDRDYYTSGLPTPQKGDDVYIMNPVALDKSVISPESWDQDNSSFGAVSVNRDTGFISLQDGDYQDLQNIGFDTTIRDLLTKMAYQRFKNTLNQFGTRYNEFLAGNFGVINQDVRLQRPECIGRSKGFFQISEVLQTSSTESDSPLGSYAGRGIGGKRTRNFRYHVQEHGYLIHLSSIVPSNGYTSGAPRWFFKESGLDFALPQFQNVGEQPIYKGELHLGVDYDVNKSDFAYQDRYSEYRSGRNYASAGMRESPFTAWHLYEGFDNDVALNEQFIQAVDSDRIFNLVDPTSVQNIVAAFTSYHYALRPISYNPK